MARVAALVPTPRVNLTPYHGVFAPNHRWRESVTPARTGRREAEIRQRTSARAPRGDDLGATIETGVKDRYPDLRALRARGESGRSSASCARSIRPSLHRIAMRCGCSVRSQRQRGSISANRPVMFPIRRCCARQSPAHGQNETVCASGHHRMAVRRQCWS